jgi:hypothetical protein
MRAAQSSASPANCEIETSMVLDCPDEAAWGGKIESRAESCVDQSVVFYACSGLVVCGARLHITAQRRPTQHG